MSFDKAIEHNKEHRKPYRGSKVFDASCRNHGDCPWCYRNRNRKAFVLKIMLDEEEEEAWYNNDTESEE